MRIVVGARCLGHFICLLDERRQQGLVGLLTIPRATAGRAKLGDNVAELRELIGALWSIIRHKGTASNVQLFTEHGFNGNPVPTYDDRTLFFAR